jgi:putative transposase
MLNWCGWWALSEQNRPAVELGGASLAGMSHARLFRCCKTRPEIIRLAVMLDVRYPPSLRNVEDLPHDRRIDVTHETVRFWWSRFGTIFAAEIRRSWVQAMRHIRHRRWHLDEVFVKISAVKHDLWRAVDHEGEVLESFVTKRRDKKAALTRRATKRISSGNR